MNKSTVLMIFFFKKKRRSTSGLCRFMLGKQQVAKTCRKYSLEIIKLFFLIHQIYYKNCHLLKIISTMFSTGAVYSTPEKYVLR